MPKSRGDPGWSIKGDVDELQKELDKALKLKKQGNAQFVEGHYQKAIKLYSEILIEIGMCACHDINSVLMHWRADVMPTDADKVVNRKQAEIDQLRVVAFNNIAMCHLKKGDYQKAVRNCTKAIQESCYKFDYKALLRRARAYRHLKDTEKAKADLRFVLRNGYKYDLQIINELKLVEMKDFESDEMVLDEEEKKKVEEDKQKEKEDKQKEQEERERMECEQSEQIAKERNDIDYMKYIVTAVSVLILAVAVAAYIQLTS